MYTIGLKYFDGKNQLGTYLTLPYVDEEHAEDAARAGALLLIPSIANMPEVTEFDPARATVIVRKETPCDSDHPIPDGHMFVFNYAAIKDK